MRRHDGPRFARAVGRARTILRQRLGWLEGYPSGDGDAASWVSLPPGQSAQTRRLGREDLQHATRAFNTLRYEFPRAIHEVVDDVALWSAHVEALLTLFKSHVHERAALDYEALLRCHPAFAPSALRDAASLRRGPSGHIVDALQWLHWFRPREFPHALRWYRPRRARLERLLAHLGGDEGTLMATLLWRLAAEHGEELVDPLLEALATEELFTVPIVDLRSVLDTALRALRQEGSLPDQRPPAEAGKLLAQWVATLPTREKKSARRALSHFAATSPVDQLKARGGFWSRCEVVLSSIRRLPPPSSRDTSAIRALQDRHRELHLLRERAPYDLPLSELFALLDREAKVTENSFELTEAFLRALGRPQDQLLAQGDDNRQTPFVWSFLAHINSLRRASHIPKRGIDALLRRFRRYLDDQANPLAALGPFVNLWRRRGPHSRAISGDHQWPVDNDILQLRPLDAIDGAFDALEHGLTLLGKLDAKQARSLIELYDALRDSEAAACLCGELDEDELDSMMLDSVARLCGLQHLSRFPTLLRYLEGRDADLYIEDADALLDTWFATHERPVDRHGPARGRLIDALCSGHLDALGRASSSRRLLENLGQTIPRLASPSASAEDERLAWIVAYPAELHIQLRQLASIDPDAERSAARILGKDFPAAEQLERELASIEAKIEASDPTAAPGLRRRRDNLRKRLRDPQRPARGRLRNLESKLLAAIERVDVLRRVGALEQAAKAALRDHLGVSPDDHELHLSPTVLELWTQKMSATTREVLSSLLRARAGPAPWDLRDHPQNEHFRESLEARGVNLHPWMEGSAPCSELVRRSVRVRFTVERDPLEVFLMGQPFGTCLAPGGIYSTSVIANAADINKQVLYGRLDDGRIVARCLLGLTADGCVVTFNPYCNVDGLDFQDVATTVARHLAGAMNTVVVPRGDVPQLLCGCWYDDGPEDLSDAKTLLCLHSTDRTLLQAPLAKVRRILETALAPLPLDRRTLPAVLELPAFAERPELSLPLLPLAVAEALDVETFQTLGGLLCSAEVGDAGERLAPRLLRHATAARRGGYLHRADELLELAVELCPRGALRLLRQSRGGGVRTWARETDGFRLWALARASEHLGHEERARRCYALAAASPCCDRHRRDAEERLAILRAGVREVGP